MVGLTIISLVLLAGTASAASSRIVGGWNTTIEEWPFMVQVVTFNSQPRSWSHSCGGVPHHQIRAGSTYRDVGGTLIHVQSVLIHPTYGQLENDGDIIIVRLVSPLTFSATVAPVRIVIPDWVAPHGTPVKHAGWGVTQVGGYFSPVLLETEIYTVDNQLCKEIYAPLRPPNIITPNMICAQYPGGGRDACNSDSGGPLLYDNILIGVIAWGEGCGNETYPGVSTAVSSYTRWILENAV